MTQVHPEHDGDVRMYEASWITTILRRLHRYASFPDYYETTLRRQRYMLITPLLTLGILPGYFRPQTTPALTSALLCNAQRGPWLWATIRATFSHWNLLHMLGNLLSAIGILPLAELQFGAPVALCSLAYGMFTTVIWSPDRDTIMQGFSGMVFVGIGMFVADLVHLRKRNLIVAVTESIVAVCMAIQVTEMNTVGKFTVCNLCHFGGFLAGCSGGMIGIGCFRHSDVKWWPAYIATGTTLGVLAALPWIRGCGA